MSVYQWPMEDIIGVNAMLDMRETYMLASNQCDNEKMENEK